MLGLIIAVGTSVALACSADYVPSERTPDAGQPVPPEPDSSANPETAPAREPDGGGAPSVQDAAVEGAVDARPQPRPDAAGDAEALEPVDLARFCERAQQLACTWATECRPFQDCDDWGGMQGLRVLCEFLPGRVSAGAVAYDPKAAGSCLAFLETVGCDAGPAIPVIAECQEPAWLIPRTATGEPCYGDWIRWGSECAEGRCVTVDACPGTCMAYQEAGQPCEQGAGCPPRFGCVDEKCVPPVQEGGNCESVPCDEDLECEVVGDSFRCIAPKEAGSACDASDPCGGLLVCIGGQCAEQSPVDGPCRVDTQCPAPQRCFQGPDGGQCGNEADLGEPCDERWSNQCASTLWCEDSVCVGPGRKDDPCTRGCAAGFWCREETLDGGTIASSCQPVGGPADACASASGPRNDACLDALVCIGGICTDPAPEGEPCEPGLDTCQPGLFCGEEDRVCHPPAALGERCAGPDSCAEGGYCVDLDGGDPFSKCEPVKAEGALCDYVAGECGSLSCSTDETDTPRCRVPARECLPAE